MSRAPDLDLDAMTPRQRKVYEEIASVRGGVASGPFAVWLRHPELAATAARLGDVLRVEGTLPPRLFELVVLATARSWTAQYQWHVHDRAGLEAGLSLAVIDALRRGSIPTFDDPEAEVTYRLVRELQEERVLSEETFGRATELLGVDAVIEIVAVLGFYTMVALTLVAFDVPAPDGVTAPLPPTTAG